MKTLLLALLIAVAAVPIFAQPTTDYSIALKGQIDDGVWKPAVRVAVGQIVHYTLHWDAAGHPNPDHVVIELDVPGEVTSIGFGPNFSCVAGDPIRCTPGNTEGLWFGFVPVEVRVDAPGTYTATARVIHQGGNSDPNPANDHATYTFEAVALPSLKLFPSGVQPRLDPGAPANFSPYVRNLSGVPATNVVLTASLPAGGTIDSAQVKTGTATCGITNNVLVCTSPSLAQNEYLGVDVSITAPPRIDGADLVVEVAVTSAEGDVDPTDNQSTIRASMVRQLMVANVEDEGSGSLRQAILDVNALCAAPQPCAIVFRIPAPVPANGWFTIQPLTPLPAITGLVKIDGKTQTLFTGETNPDGPEIEINGALAGSNAGLRLRPHCEMEISNLAVNGFAGFGVDVAPPAATEPCMHLTITVRENYLGTDPRGRIAKPNQRGLGLAFPEAYVYGNVIGGNRRAGIYITNGSYHAIGGNRIGIGTDGSPLGNGAGIFVDMGYPEALWEGADIHENVIAYNDGMAIARTRNGQIWISGNSIFDNLQQGIDVGIDGPTAQRADDKDVPNAPVLFSATYDAAQNATIVRGRIDSEVFAHRRYLEIYASARLSVWATPQAEQSVAIAEVQTGHQDFEVVVPGDLRGKWITATHNAAYFLQLRSPRGIGMESHRGGQPTDTSELSNAVVVH
jgi:uncharacterized repeat protein (TIGR01451 family)